MAQPTLLQRYYLIVIATLRWLGATAAAAGLVITVVNLPAAVRGGGKLLALIGAGAGCAAVGLAFYAAGTVVQRKYRDHLAEQLD